MKNMSNRKKNFNEFRFNGLNFRQETNKYMTMNRVSADKNKIVVKTGANHLFKSRYGYGLIVDEHSVVWLKEWQVNSNWYTEEDDSVEIVLDRKFWKVVKFGDFWDGFGKNDTDFDFWLECAEVQQKAENKVKWEI